MQVRTIGICDFVDILEDHPAYEIEQVGEFQLETSINRDFGWWRSSHTGDRLASADWAG
ncbi:hypothetical protein LG047_07765 [Methylocystis sp. WRRC1]|uniref:hypothetical protein n=1 Tax=Methylocystis sp. WRRC1 TaxID=1732014 RepID=UPI001D13E490|nr:hypothetical protein [Methylocystis sp. WRRC1]MCC3245216.1 hypothetical protein [Methylocystis sp. WRRC1]